MIKINQTKLNDLEYKEAKIKIDKEYELELAKPVTVTIPEGTFDFVGGWDSGVRIRFSAQLSEEMGEASIVITDANKAPRVMTIESAYTVSRMVAADYRAKFHARQSKCFAANKNT